MSLLLLLAIPVVVGVGAFLLGKREVTPLEALAQIALVGALLGGGWLLARWAAVRDVEIWNARVASKRAGTESCCHSYRCHCHMSCSGSGKKRHCHEECDTCYRHDHDLTWTIESTLGETVFSDRCSPPETPPPRVFAATGLGDPTAQEHPYTNYLRADPGRFHRELLGRFAGRLPAYPRVSGFAARRFLFVDISEPAADDLDAALARLEPDLFAARRANAIVVVVAEADPAYADALAAAWLGGKDNDVVLVVGAPAYPAIAWARVLAWNRARGPEDELKDNLQTRVERLGTFDGAVLLGILGDEIERHYVQRPVSDFAGLMHRATPPRMAMLLLVLLGLLGSCVLTCVLSWNRSRYQGRMPGEALRAWWARRRKP